MRTRNEHHPSLTNIPTAWIWERRKKTKIQTEKYVQWSAFWQHQMEFQSKMPTLPPWTKK
jgi:hypothetical protein